MIKTEMCGGWCGPDFMLDLPSRGNAIVPYPATLWLLAFTELALIPIHVCQTAGHS